MFPIVTRVLSIFLKTTASTASIEKANFKGRVV